MTMLGASVWDYLFIRTCIALLYMVAPLSLLYSIAGALIQLPFRIPRMLELWLASEAAFYLFIYLPLYAYLQTPATYPTIFSRDDRRKLFYRCHSTIPDPERYLSRWFRDTPASEIRRENVKDFFRWAFLNTGDPDPAYDEELEQYTREMEDLLGRRLPPGRGKASPLRLTLERVDMLHRSLAWYLCVFVVDTVTSACMRYHAFEFYTNSSLFPFFDVFPFRPITLVSPHRAPTKILTYWHRPHTSKTRRPILFIHGIGVGLYPYVNFLADLKASDEADPSGGQVGIIALEIMPISSRITGGALLKDDMSEEVRRILEAHGWERFVLVSHSYGSVVTTHLLHSPQVREKISSMMFIDPVSFLLHLPDVAYNFTHRKPTHANEYLLSYFGAKDIGVSHTLYRRFFWADNVLWKEDIQKYRVTVALSGRDAIVDTERVRAYLSGAKDWRPEAKDWEGGVWSGDLLDVLWFPELDHGQPLNEAKTRATLVSAVRNLCAEE
ncbi:hypothetical protein VdG2_05782 [Verticillium dahliae VDG2]|nr:hypothetical protein VdG2_05782 [Verticillium dahliae VDG2]